MLTIEQYFLVQLQEELSEVSKHISKALRFGIHSCKPGTQVSEEAHILDELDDVDMALVLLRELGQLPQQHSSQARWEARRAKVLKHYRHSVLQSQVEGVTQYFEEGIAAYEASLPPEQRADAYLRECFRCGERAHAGECPDWLKCYTKVLPSLGHPLFRLNTVPIGSHIRVTQELWTSLGFTGEPEPAQVKKVYATGNSGKAHYVAAYGNKEFVVDTESATPVDTFLEQSKAAEASQAYQLGRVDSYLEKLKAEGVRASRVQDSIVIEELPEGSRTLSDHMQAEMDSVSAHIARGMSMPVGSYATNRRASLKESGWRPQEPPLIGIGRYILPPLSTWWDVCGLAGDPQPMRVEGYYTGGYMASFKAGQFRVSWVGTIPAQDPEAGTIPEEPPTTT